MEPLSAFITNSAFAFYLFLLPSMSFRPLQSDTPLGDI